MTIRYGFARNGDFIAIDTDTKAAERGYKGSQYWREASAGFAEETAKDMIEAALMLRQEFPDMPSHQPEVWNAKFAELSALSLSHSGTESEQ